MQLSEIYIYPIKSLAGIQLKQSNVTLRGLENDRRFMLTTLDGTFLTQRNIPQMALLQTKITDDQLLVYPKNRPSDNISIPLKPDRFYGTQKTNVWNTDCEGKILDKATNQWFSKRLDTSCQLIYMTDDHQRAIEQPFGQEGEIVSFADGFPFLLLGKSSMDDLNQRLKHPVSVNRFRANLVFSGGKAFEEDNWKYFKIGRLTFRVAKPCARCQVPNINQETGLAETEPNRTLAGYRRIYKNKITFGMNVCWEKEKSEGIERLRTGDEVRELMIREIT